MAMTSKYVNFFIVLVFLRICDLYLTYQITPDLSREWNPLVSYFNLSWQGFLGVQLLLVCIALMAYHRYEQRKRNPVDKPNLPPVRFAFYYLNGYEFSWRNWIESFLRLPNKQRFMKSSVFTGFVIAASCILASLFAITHNLLILGEFPAYHKFIHFNNQLYLPSVYLTLVTTSCLTFFVIEYNKYKFSNKSQANRKAQTYLVGHSHVK